MAQRPADGHVERRQGRRWRRRRWRRRWRPADAPNRRVLIAAPGGVAALEKVCRVAVLVAAVRRPAVVVDPSVVHPHGGGGRSALALTRHGHKPGVFARGVAIAEAEHRVRDALGEPTTRAGGDVLVENEALGSSGARLVGAKGVRVGAVDKAGALLIGAGRQGRVAGRRPRWRRRRRWGWRRRGRRWRGRRRRRRWRRRRKRWRRGRRRRRFHWRRRR